MGLQAPTRLKSRLKCGACGAMPICQIFLEKTFWMETSQSGTSMLVISPHLKNLKYNLSRTMLWLFLSAFCSPWLLCCFKQRTSFENSVVGLLFKHISPRFGLISAYPLHLFILSPSIVLFM